MSIKFQSICSLLQNTHPIIELENLKSILDRQNTWVSVNMLQVVRDKPEYYMALINGAYRMTKEAFLYLIQNNLSNEKINELVLRKVLLPSLWCDDTDRIGNIEFLKEVYSSFKIHLDSNQIYMPREIGISWEIIISQYLIRIGIPLLQTNLPPYIIIEILNQLPFICKIPHRIKAKYILGIFKSRFRIYSMRINIKNDSQFQV